MKGAAGSDPAPGDAAGWIARVRSGPLSEADRSRLEAWLAASPTNERAFAQLASNLAILDVIRSEPEILAMREAARHAGHGRLRRWSAVAAGLAVLSLIVSAATYLVRLSPAPMGSTTIAYATDVGEIGRVRLPDGSLAVLDARSSRGVSSCLRGVPMSRSPPTREGLSSSIPWGGR
jgi:transmembrane sensor